MAHVIITFHVRCSLGEMNVYWSRPSVCLSVCLSLAAFPHSYMDADVSWENGSGCFLVVHYWGFAVGARVSLLWQHSAEREMSASACTCSIGGLVCLGTGAGEHAWRMQHSFSLELVGESRTNEVSGWCFMVEVSSLQWHDDVGWVIWRTFNL